MGLKKDQQRKWNSLVLQLILLRLKIIDAIKNIRRIKNELKQQVLAGLNK